MPRWMKAGALIDGCARVVCHASNREALLAAGAEDTWQYRDDIWYGLMPEGYTPLATDYAVDPMLEDAK